MKATCMIDEDTLILLWSSQHANFLQWASHFICPTCYRQYTLYETNSQHPLWEDEKLKNQRIDLRADDTLIKYLEEITAITGESKSAVITRLIIEEITYLRPKTITKGKQHEPADLQTV
jgi:hypothetical protein